MLHRNSQKRIYFDDAVYFITFVTKGRVPFFREEIFCNIFIKDLKICKRLKDFRLYGFVIMPDHVHLLIHPGEKYNISQILHNLKRTSSLHINWIINNPEGEDSLLEGEDIYPRLREGISIQKQKIKFQWQKSFFDHYIRNDHDFNYHLEYIWINPEKHKIIDNFENYKYSSYNNYKDLIDNPN